MNKVMLSGYVGKLFDVGKGGMGVSFLLATRESKKTDGGGWQNYYERHPCVAFGKVGDFIRKCGENSVIEVEGRMTTKQVTEAWKTSVIVSRATFAPQRKEASIDGVKIDSSGQFSFNPDEMEE